MAASYVYEHERKRIFTESGVQTLLTVQGKALNLCRLAGAVRMDKLLDGDAWTCLAAADYLCECGMLREITCDVAGQHRIFVLGGAA